MSSFACITTDEWARTQQFDKALEGMTHQYVNSLESQKEQVRQTMEQRINELDSQIQHEKQHLR